MPPTIHDGISSYGPVLGDDVCKAKLRTIRPAPIGMDQTQITPWADFSFDNLLWAFEGLLAEPLSKAVQIPPEDTIHSIDGVPGVKRMAERHLASMLRGPLRDGANILARRMRRDLPSIHVDGEMRLENTGKPPYSPAFNIYLGCENDKARYRRLVFGVARTSSTWSSELLSGRTLDARAMDPLIQLAPYARIGNSPYSVIITELEVVVVRFYSGRDSSFGAQWKAVSWDFTGKECLTAGMAVWCLALIALNEDKRRIQPLDSMLPVNAWASCEDLGGKVVAYRHHFSIETRRLLPFGAITH